MDGVILIGVQASGKSSFYQQCFSKTHVRINLDMLKTRARERILLDACLSTMQPVVIDNTNVTELDRAKYIQKFREFGFKIDGYYFSSSVTECLARNGAREG
ncbi:MAG: ATP-binding protein, partial [Pseudomonadales bacterium]|nr:ATP-binding protein [Pseudomonadales bacterium]